jgi:hypothetical protein
LGKSTTFRRNICFHLQGGKVSQQKHRSRWIIELTQLHYVRTDCEAVLGREHGASRKEDRELYDKTDLNEGLGEYFRYILILKDVREKEFDYGKSKTFLSRCLIT